jgi:hypothetical protein
MTAENNEQTDVKFQALSSDSSLSHPTTTEIEAAKSPTDSTSPGFLSSASLLS